MDKQQVIAALEKYEQRLSVHGSFTPERLDEESMGKTVVSISQRRALCHILWMCGQTKKFVEEDRMEKAMRWLGFIQASLWMASFFSINNLKVDNMPPGETLDPKRV